MIYITHHEYAGQYLNGDGEISLPFGTPVEKKGGAIFYGDKIICTTCSLVCNKHFARNDDGEGLKRGALSYAIAYSPRDTGTGYRFTENERFFLCENFPHWLKDLPDTILFNADFFNADVKDLMKLADFLKIGSDYFVPNH